MNRKERRTLKVIQASKKPCGDCQACCTGMQIMSLFKPPHQACLYLTKEGCSVHEGPAQPLECGQFFCLWTNKDSKLKDEDRPDRSGVILTWNPVFGAITAHASKPGSLDEAKDLLDRLEALGHELVLVDGFTVLAIRAGKAVTDRVWKLIEPVKEATP